MEKIKYFFHLISFSIVISV